MEARSFAGAKPDTNIAMREYRAISTKPYASFEARSSGNAALRPIETSLAEIDGLSELLATYFTSTRKQCVCQSPPSLPVLSMDATMALNLSVGQVCLHREVTDAVLPLARSAAERLGIPEAVEYLLATLASRCRWHSADRSNRHIVSLGETCLPKTIPTKWGLKRSKSMGELTMPFDLAIHPVGSVGDIIRDGFDTYLSEKHLSYDDVLGYVIDPLRNIHWNHETGKEYTENAFEKHKSVYLKRISNFKTVASGRILWFLNSVRSLDPSTLSTLVDALMAGYPATDGRLALLTSDEDRPTAISDGMVNGLSVSVLNLPLPMPSYEWWFCEHFATRAGLAWESAIVDWLADLI